MILPPIVARMLFFWTAARVTQSGGGNAPCLRGGPRWPAFRRRLTIAFRAALSFDVRHLIWEVVPCRLAAGSAGLEKRPAGSQPRPVRAISGGGSAAPRCGL